MVICEVAKFHVVPNCCVQCTLSTGAFVANCTLLASLMIGDCDPFFCLPFLDKYFRFPLSLQFLAGFHESREIMRILRSYSSGIRLCNVPLSAKYHVSVCTLYLYYILIKTLPCDSDDQWKPYILHTIPAQLPLHIW